MRYLLYYLLVWATDMASPFVVEKCGLHFEPERAVVVLDVVVVCAVIYHLCHEQIERRHCHSQSEQVEQRCQAVATEQIQ